MLRGIDTAKDQIKMIKAQIEMEQRNIAELVCMDLNDMGYKSEIVKDGEYHITIKFIPYKIEKLTIKPKGTYSEDELKIFEKQKKLLANKYGVMRRDVIREETKKLKERKKNEKKNSFCSIYLQLGRNKKIKGKEKK